MSTILMWSLLGAVLVAAWPSEARGEASTATPPASTAASVESAEGGAAEAAVAAEDGDAGRSEEPKVDADPASAERDSRDGQKKKDGGGISRTLQGPRDLQRRIYTQINFRRRDDDEDEDEEEKGAEDGGRGDQDARTTRTRNDADGDDDDVKNGRSGAAASARKTPNRSSSGGR